MSEYASDGTFTAAPCAIGTYSGRRFDPFNPDPVDIDLGDIAHALARICRFNGHVEDQVEHSVAAHSMRVASFLEGQGHPRDVLAQGLLHDAAEAYLGDITRPVRKHPGFGFFLDAERALMTLIFERFGLPVESHPAVAEADALVLHFELSSRRVPAIGPGGPNLMAAKFLAHAATLGLVLS